MKDTELRLFLCGDVMLGRGIDQIQRHRSDPRLYEPFVTSALDYVELAERTSGPISRNVAADYVWGDALTELARVQPAVRIINLETAVTASDDAWPGKGIHYRMHPGNVGVLTSAGIDCCVLANNHVLDWGHTGLIETLDTLHGAGIRTAGAGRNAEQAARPAIIDVSEKSRVLLFGFATLDCGSERGWAATSNRAGIALLPELSQDAVATIAARVRMARQPGDVVIVSVHWGGNWGYAVAPAQRGFAHALIDKAQVDIVHGHSSHHPKGIEVHRGRLILYGCGDFINDYEGIGGHEEYSADLGLMHFPGIDATSGTLVRHEMTATRMHRFRVGRARPEEAQWVAATLDRESRRFATHVDLRNGGELRVGW